MLQGFAGPIKTSFQSWMHPEYWIDPCFVLFFSEGRTLERLWRPLRTRPTYKLSTGKGKKRRHLHVLKSHLAAASQDLAKRLFLTIDLGLHQHLISPPLCFWAPPCWGESTVRLAACIQLWRGGMGLRAFLDRKVVVTTSSLLPSPLPATTPRVKGARPSSRSWL